MSRKWVVISEETFNQLCNKKLAKTIDNSESEASDLIKTREVIDSIPIINSESKIIENESPIATYSESARPENTNHLDPDSDQKKIITQLSRKSDKVKKNLDSISDLEELIPGHKWVEELPPSFRREGLRLLKQIDQAKGFSVDSKGFIYLDKKLVENYSISDFLRVTCIPFHKGEIPNPLKEWLKTNQITKFRNHLATIRPAWTKRYSWRKSTMGTRQEPSGDH